MLSILTPAGSGFPFFAKGTNIRHLFVQGCNFSESFMSRWEIELRTKIIPRLKPELKRFIFQKELQIYYRKKEIPAFFKVIETVENV